MEKTYKVRIEETLAKEIEVVAESEEQAMDKAQKMYEDGDVVLDSSDFTDYDIIITN